MLTTLPQDRVWFLPEAGAQRGETWARFREVPLRIEEGAGKPARRTGKE